MPENRKPEDSPEECPEPDMIEGIDAPPELVAFKVMNTRPKREGEWEYQKERRRRRRRNRPR